MTRFIYLLIIATLLPLSAIANDEDSYFSLYLVRHAEKQVGKDPQLTACGKLRAKQLATLLAPINIEAIYSTAYQRTMNTAAPTAKQKALPIKHYLPSSLTQLALQLKTLKETALIVGHSNTTTALLALLTNNDALNKPLAESDYQKLYQLQFINDRVYLTEFKQPLVCAKELNQIAITL